MTLLLDETKNEPQTHALVVGVSAYPHLRGGRKIDDAPAEDTFGLKQLSSPSISAHALADWLQTRFNNPTTPLGSLDLLITDGGAINGPTKAELKTAIRAWENRADRHEENIALFYYSGHGLSTRGELSLLASDFGDPTGPKFENAIDFDALVTGMEWCKALHQVFFVDACRNEPRSLLEYSGIGDGGILEQRTSAPEGGPRKQSIYYATARDQSAHGRPGEPSRFTSAVLCGLNGAGSQKKPTGTSVVNTFWLADSISATLELGNRLRGTLPQELSTGKLARLDLHLPDEPFSVPVAVTCQPQEARRLAELIVTPPGQPPLPSTPAAEDLWLLDLEADPEPYEFTLHFPSGLFADTSDVLEVGPAFRDLQMEAQQ